MSIKPMWTGAVGWRVGRGTGHDWAFPCLMARLIINPLSNYEMVKTNEISATRFLMSVLPIPLTLCLRHTNDNICICHAPWSLHNTWIWNFFVSAHAVPAANRCWGRGDNETAAAVCATERLYLTICSSIAGVVPTHFTLHCHTPVTDGVVIQCT